jgi:hypothetical protein
MSFKFVSSPLLDSCLGKWHSVELHLYHKAKKAIISTVVNSLLKPFINLLIIIIIKQSQSLFILGVLERRGGHK